MNMTPIEKIKRWTDTNGHVFKLEAIWNPNEEYDVWARYTREDTGQEYTCRLEAFRSRFIPLVD